MGIIWQQTPMERDASHHKLSSHSRILITTKTVTSGNWNNPKGLALKRWWAFDSRTDLHCGLWCWSLMLMTNNTAQQGNCLFLQIWPKIKEHSFLQALYVCPNQMTSGDTPLICYITALAILHIFIFFYFLCGNITCVWYSGGRCPLGGGRMSRAGALFFIWMEH